MFSKDEDQKKKLQVGDLAPNFTAKVQNPDGSQSELELKKLLEEGQKVLLVFYPGDDTPGCTQQLCGIRDLYADYEDLGVTVLGVNPADGESHLKFIKKYNYQFGIIVDEDKSIRESYGAVGSFFGNVITKRCVFLIDETGKIIFTHVGQQDNQKIFKLLRKEENSEEGDEENLTT